MLPKNETKSIKFRPRKVYPSNPLNKIFTVREIHKLWGIPITTIQAELMPRKNGYLSKFRQDEVRQSGSVWLITEKGIERVFGNKYYRKDKEENTSEFQ